MKKLLTAIAAVLISCSLAVPAYAQGTGHSGWTTVDGKQYYYKTDGTRANSSCNIGGIRYRFSSDGVCLGRYTGWTGADGRKFYYDDGVKQFGWVNVPGDSGSGRWYYIDGKKGRLTGTQKIGGFTYTFDSGGRWDGSNACYTAKDGKTVNNSVIALKVMSDMSKKHYGGVYVADGMCVVWSVDGKAEEKIGKWFPEAGFVVYRKADFSLYQLEEARKNFDSPKSARWTGVYCDYFTNRLVVEAEEGEMYDSLKKYADSLPCRNMVRIESGGAVIPDSGDIVYGDIDDSGFQSLDEELSAARMIDIRYPYLNRKRFENGRFVTYENIRPTDRKTIDKIRKALFSAAEVSDRAKSAEYSLDGEYISVSTDKGRNGIIYIASADVASYNGGALYNLPKGTYEKIRSLILGSSKQEKEDGTASGRTDF